MVFVRDDPMRAAVSLAFGNQSVKERTSLIFMRKTCFVSNRFKDRPIDFDGRLLSNQLKCKIMNDVKEAYY